MCIHDHTSRGIHILHAVVWYGRMAETGTETTIYTNNNKIHIYIYMYPNILMHPW